MPISIRPLTRNIAGEVSGVDITKPLSKDEVAAIEAGMDKHAVLVFRDQDLTDEQQMAFTRNFGTIEDARGGNVTKPQDKRLATGMNDVSNLGKDGKPLARDSRQRLFNIGNMLWHSDSSFRAIPAKYSLLSARVVNKKGGNTEFAHMGAAYEALDEETRAEIESLICEHSLMYSRGSLGFLDYTEEEKVMFKPVRQRLVRSHPVTGRKSLYLSSHAGAILGHAHAGGADAPQRPQGARHPAAVRLRPQMAPAGPRDVGQPPDHASRAPLRREPAARHAAHHGGRRFAHSRATSGRVAGRRGRPLRDSRRRAVRHCSRSACARSEACARHLNS